MSFLFKWQRFIFILISLEYLVLSLFLYYSFVLSSFLYFFFISFTVISSVIGMVLIIGSVKFFGRDMCVFYRFKLSLNYQFSKLEIIFCRGFIINFSIFLFRRKGLNLRNLIMVYEGLRWCYLILIHLVDNEILSRQLIFCTIYVPE